MTSVAQPELLGAKKMSRELDLAILELSDLSEAHGRAARTITAAGRGAAPRLTGALASSHRGSGSRSGAEIIASAVYANPIHWGWRGHNIEPSLWLTTAAQRSESTWVNYYSEEVDSALDLVRGLAR